MCAINFRCQVIDFCFFDVGARAETWGVALGFSIFKETVRVLSYNFHIGQSRFLGKGFRTSWWCSCYQWLLESTKTIKGYIWSFFIFLRILDFIFFSDILQELMWRLLSPISDTTKITTTCMLPKQDMSIDLPYQVICASYTCLIWTEMKWPTTIARSSIFCNTFRSSFWHWNLENTKTPNQVIWSDLINVHP